MGGTRTVMMEQEGDILYIAFRGSAGTKDWADNSHFGLVQLQGHKEEEKVHRGFHERAESILKDLLVKIPEELPKTFVITGHSLGAALSQVVYIQLKDKIMEARNLKEFNSKIINISFAGPVVGNMDLRRRLLDDDKAKNMYHFVLAEDIIPAAPFYRHAYQRLPEPQNGFRKQDWYQGMLNMVFQVLGEGKVPDEYQDLFVPPMYEQPVYDNDSSMEPYAPIGNYLYIKDGKLYELPFDTDPQAVAQTLINILEVMRQMASVQALTHPKVKMGHPLVVKLRADHWIKNYDDKLAAFDI